MLYSQYSVNFLNSVTNIETLSFAFLTHELNLKRLVVIFGCRFWWCDINCFSSSKDFSTVTIHCWTFTNFCQTLMSVCYFKSCSVVIKFSCVPHDSKSWTGALLKVHICSSLFLLKQHAWLYNNRQCVCIHVLLLWWE